MLTISSKRFNTTLRLLLFLALSTVLILFIEISPSPLYEDSMVDTCVWHTIACGWMDGLTPYADMFDNKGPYLLLSQVVSLSLNPVWGMVVLLIANLTVVLELVYRGLRTILPQAGPWSIVGGFITFFIIYVASIDGGNVSEEWSLIFIMWPMLLFFRSCMTGRQPMFYTAVYGFCIGVLALIRINNACIPVSIVLVAAATIISRREWRLLGRHALVFLAGFAVSTLPMVIYLAAKGALGDMIFCTYTFNFSYSVYWEYPDLHERLWRVIHNTESMAPVLLMVPVAWAKRTDLPRQAVWFMILAPILGYLVFVNSTGYQHYFLVTMPLAVVAVSMTLTLIKRRWVAAAAIVVAAMIFYERVDCRLNIGDSPWQRDIGEYEKFQKPIEEMVEKNVPASEIPHMYVFSVDSYIGGMNKFNCFSAGKYNVFQPYYANISRRIEKEIVDYQLTQRPKYLLVRNIIPLKFVNNDVCGALQVMIRDYTPIDSVKLDVMTTVYRYNGPSKTDKSQ